MDLSPKQIVYKLDKYIIGQDEAKKAVAIALRNRYRRAQLPPEIREEITPKNIIMKGPTGVGKTEIARRLAKLVKAPFVKVEATKYTEVGYVGKDVEGMIRDLAECAYRLVKAEKSEEVKAKATAAAERRLLRVLAEAKKDEKGDTAKEVFEAELLDGLVLARERLNQLLIADRLVDERGLLAAGFGLQDEHIVRRLGDEVGDQQRYGRDDHDRQRDRDAERDHEGERAQDRQDAGKQLREAHEQAVRKGVHVRDHAADGIAGGMAVQIRQRKLVNVGKGVAADVAHDGVGDAVV